MKIYTHDDLIWSSGCMSSEDNIVKKLKSSANCEVQLVDSVNYDTATSNNCLITDNHFLNERKNVIQLAPELWHIYYFEHELQNITPVYKFNCLMNRLSGERLMLLYKLQERDLVHDNIISFNCSLHNQIDATVGERKKRYRDFHRDCQWPHWNEVHEELYSHIPKFLPADIDPDTAAMLSEVTIVVESYVSDTVIAFSEKIFRALQTPRPWLLFCSPGSVALLRNYGFDVLDDLIDHSYDAIEKDNRRADKILNQINKIQFNAARCEQAAAYNRLILQKLATKWPAKLDKIIKDVTITV
jgi:hypothetical protein